MEHEFKIYITCTGLACKIGIANESASSVACNTRATVIGVLVVTSGEFVTLSEKRFFCFISTLADSVVCFDSFTRIRRYGRARLL